MSRQPWRSISAAASGDSTNVPTPMPATAKPTARARWWSNHPPTSAIIGTYPHAAATPTPAPYVTYPAANESTRLVASRPSNNATAPTARIGRGPQRSSARPVMMLSEKNVNVVSPKMTAVALRSAPKSSLIDSKKAPKL